MLRTVNICLSYSKHTTTFKHTTFNIVLHFAWVFLFILPIAPLLYFCILSHIEQQYYLKYIFTDKNIQKYAKCFLILEDRNQNMSQMAMLLVTGTEHCRNGVKGNLANSSYWSKGTLEANEARRGKSIYSHTAKCCSEAKKQASYPQNIDSKKQ